MQVSHVERNMMEQSCTIPNSQSIRSKEYLGLDLIDPKSSFKLNFPISVRATQMYAKKELVGDIFSDRQTEEAKAELLQVRPEFEERMKELVLIRDTTKQALEIFSGIK